MRTSSSPKRLRARLKLLSPSQTAIVTRVDARAPATAIAWFQAFALHEEIPADLLNGVLDRAYQANCVALTESDAIKWADGFKFSAADTHRDTERLERAHYSLAKLQVNRRAMHAGAGLCLAYAERFFAKFAHALDERDIAIITSFADIGVHIHTQPHFRPNETPPELRRKYIRIHPAFDKLMHQLWMRDFILLLPTALLPRIKEKIHFSPPHWVLKKGSVFGRAIGDVSNVTPPPVLAREQSPNLPLNHDGVKLEGIARYGEIRHPSIVADLLPLIFAAEEKFSAQIAAGEKLILFKLDVKSAFHLLSVHKDSVALLAFQLLNGYTMFWLVAFFGWACFPHCWNVVARILRAALRADAITGFLDIYVDDLCGLTIQSALSSDIQIIKDTLELLLGQGSVAEDKTESGRRLVWIGWLVDLDSDSLSVAEPLLLKAIHAFSCANIDAMSRNDLERLASLGARFTLVFPQLRQATAAIYNEYRGLENNITKRISARCRSALGIWRLFLCRAIAQPQLFHRPLSQFRNVSNFLVVRFDASLSGIGFQFFWGGRQSEQPWLVGAVAIPDDVFHFNNDPSNQNFAEFMAGAYALTTLASLGINNCNIHLIGDSRAALKWLARGTFFFGKHASTATFLTSLLIEANLRIVDDTWISTKDNHECDALSRIHGIDTTVDPMDDYQPEQIIHTATQTWQTNFFAVAATQPLDDDIIGFTSSLRAASQLVSNVLVAARANPCVTEYTITISISSSFANITRRQYIEVSSLSTIPALLEKIACCFECPVEVLRVQLVHAAMYITLNDFRCAPLGALIPGRTEDAIWCGSMRGGSTPSFTMHISDAQHISSLLVDSILPQSRRTYSIGWRRWKQFLLEHSNSDDVYLQRISMCQRPFALLTFIFWLTREHQASSSQVRIALASVRYHFLVNLSDTTWFDDTRIASARRSTREHARTTSLRRLRGTGPGRIRGLANVHFVTFLRDSALMLNTIPTTNTRKQFLNAFCVYLASAFMFNFGCRCSNACHVPGLADEHQHAIRVHDIEFLTSDGSVWLPIGLAPHIRAQTMSAHSIVAARIFIHSAKVHRIMGALEFVSRRSQAESQFLNDLIWWTSVGCALRLNREDSYLFSHGFIPRTRLQHYSVWYARREHINSAIKRAAEYFGHASHNFTSKSWRVSGSSTLRARGFSDEAVRTFGNWSSDAAYIYQQNMGGEIRPLALD